MKLEICANSFESALAAQAGGAHRIELCQELALGGITPSYGLIEKVVEELKIPVFLLIRPRSGDFTYSQSEFDVMLRDIKNARSIGVQGIVSGILTADFEIDRERTAKLIASCGDLPFTFHRGFDWTVNPAQSLKHLIDLGVDRVLTSGQQETAVAGIELLKKLHKQSQGRIKILPGGGITPTNIRLFKQAGFYEVHSSASITKTGIIHSLEMHSIKDLQEQHLRYSTSDSVKQMVDLL